MNFSQFFKECLKMFLFLLSHTHFSLLRTLYPHVCCVLSCSSCVRLLATASTVAHQAPLYMGILQARILEWFIHRGWEKQLLLSRQFDVVQLSSRVQLFMTPWTAACQPSLSLTISWSLQNAQALYSLINLLTQNLDT